ncbi:MAG: Mut7-C RNAse domain-containing protein [Candidatus Thermoplasmatota archaeon]|jgi:uncharacterized protein with PIN domain|nr:Mut7-C RNAse domain-containing protein [Candidatus Sysuiplasma jiujiangense]MBX8639385.1 hypothetical protein [Candidatus Sysuiplasma jiujiangense]MCL4316704.1 Mut7-C RNAse domain-containing protein [Candidatus Thermoplasmatota archaeon]
MNNSGQADMNSESMNSESAEPRFLADRMLGKLARWLRILGFDTEYADDTRDVEIARRAAEESRILLTRDRELSANRKIRAIYIPGIEIEDQLITVMNTLGVTPHIKTVRCTLCNSTLSVITPAEASAETGAGIASRHEVFYKCVRCGKIYWQGSHWDRIFRTVAALGAKCAEDET